MSHWLRRLAGAFLTFFLVGCFGTPLQSKLQVDRSCGEPFEIKGGSLRQELKATGLVIVGTSTQKGSSGYADYVRLGIDGHVMRSGAGMKGDPIDDDARVTVTGNIYRVRKGVLPSLVGEGNDRYLFELEINHQRILLLKRLLDLPETDACDFPRSLAALSLFF